MPSKLEQLPYDILFSISQYIDLEDVFNFASTCEQLRIILDESTLCRRVIEHCAPRALEVSLARKGQVSYPQALRRLYNRRRALSTGSPAAVSKLGYGSDFLYDQGHVCLLSGDQISFYNVIFGRQQLSIPILKLLGPLPGRHSPRPRLTLLSFNDDIVTLLYEDCDAEENWLLAIDVRNGVPEHVIVPKLLTSTSKLFVRHTRDVLYYGTHSTTNSRGHREWIIQGIVLRNSDLSFPLQSQSSSGSPEGNNESIKIQLYDFPGMDVGSTIVFKIHDGYFYALSNCSSFDVVEVDWTSFYNIRRFPLDKPPPSNDLIEKNQRVYRRQHWEGPVNDGWTDLSLQVDEQTNELMIVEGRKEWRGGASSQTRTFYISQISLEEEEDPGLQVPEDDPFGPLSTSDSKYAPDQERLQWQVHPEDNHGCNSPRHSRPDSFILAWTKFRSYNLSAKAFVDIVTDPDCCGRGTHCIRIRAGSRRESPLHPVWQVNQGTSVRGKAKMIYPVTFIGCPTPEYSLPLGEESGSYRYSPIYLWPPPSEDSVRASKAHDLLNLDIPEGKNKTSYGVIGIKAIADERSIVYMIKDSSKGPNAVGKLVCICFDADAAICAHDGLISEESQASGNTLEKKDGDRSQAGSRRGQNHDGHHGSAISAAARSRLGPIPSSSGTSSVPTPSGPSSRRAEVRRDDVGEAGRQTQDEAEMLRRYHDDIALYEREASFDELWTD